jgi:hypothetical protein
MAQVMGKGPPHEFFKGDNFEQELCDIMADPTWLKEDGDHGYLLASKLNKMLYPKDEELRRSDSTKRHWSQVFGLWSRGEDRGRSVWYMAHKQRVKAFCDRMCEDIKKADTALGKMVLKWNGTITSNYEAVAGLLQQQAIKNQINSTEETAPPQPLEKLQLQAPVASPTDPPHTPQHSAPLPSAPVAPEPPLPPAPVAPQKKIGNGGTKRKLEQTGNDTGPPRQVEICNTA